MTTETDYSDYVLVATINNQVFIGKTNEPVGAPCLTLTNICALVTAPGGGLSVAPPMFPCSNITVRPAFVIRLPDLQHYKNLSKVLREHFLKLNTGLVIAKG